jgi:glucose-1-phosphate thymidylyltransferase
MNAILLAAGYGTRLYPLTRDCPKPLLRVGGKPIMDHIVERLAHADEVDALFVVTNARFAKQFDQRGSTGSCGRPSTRPGTGGYC